MQVKLAKPADMDIEEKQIQQAFEQNLEWLEEGLRMVGSFVRIGTGIIDTLAIDEDNVPVFIEYKRPGEFDQDAVLQLMEYYSWFVTDQNHLLHLKEVIQNKFHDVKEIVEEIRLMAVVSDVEDRVKNACWAIKPPIKLVTYSLFENGEDSYGIVPKIMLDTSESTERLVAQPKTEEDHIGKHPEFKSLYQEIKTKISSLGSDVTFNPAPQHYIAAMRNKAFCTLHFKNKWIRLDINISHADTGNDSRLHPQGGKWSYVHITSAKDLDEVLSWIQIAYSKAI